MSTGKSLHDDFGPDAPRVLRGAMADAAERVGLPDRFRVTYSTDRPEVRITDTATGQSTTVPLFAYGPVRAVLNDLFGSPGRGE